MHWRVHSTHCLEKNTDQGNSLKGIGNKTAIREGIEPILSGNQYIAKIVCKSWKAVQVEITSKCLWKCWLRPSSRLDLEIKPHPTRWHYPLINFCNKDLISYPFMSLVHFPFPHRTEKAIVSKRLVILVCIEFSRR